MGKVLVIGNADFSSVAVKKVDFLKGSYIKITTTIKEAETLVSGEGFYAIGETATLTATSNVLYSFVRWSDGVTDSVRTITVTSEGSLNLYAEYEINYVDNDFTWGNGGVTSVGKSSGTLNLTASTVDKLIHTLAECKFAINTIYAEDYLISAYASTSRVVHTTSYNLWQEGEYISNYNKNELTIPAGRYVQIAIHNEKSVSFTSDLSLCSEILLVAGQYELTT